MLREPRAPVIDYPPDGSVRPVTRLVWHPAPIGPPVRRSADALPGVRVVVVGDDEAAVARVARALEQHGATVLSQAASDVADETALADVRSRLGDIDGVIDLNVDRPEETNEPADWQPALRRTVAVLKACYADWIQETDCRRRFYVTVTGLGGAMGFGDGPVPQPFGGIWAGLAKTLPRELPNCNVKVIDLDSAARRRLDQIVLDELYDWGLFEIGYRNGQRYGLTGRKEDAPAPRITLNSTDTILISGGSRGIGFALAKGLAAEFECRVVVTGRSPLPPQSEAWLGLDEAGFKAYEISALKSPPPGKTVAQARRDVDRLRQLRELARNMNEVRNLGLRVEYAACDFTVSEQVHALLERLGPGLTGIIHNAGVSAPTRLPSKPIDSFLATVETKVGGFFNLWRAVSERSLKFFCNVGSLVGRWGGMVGEIDYAAANEGLSRAGQWAARRSAFPVLTVCWPTWERLGGMIKNYHVTLQYTSALHVEEGVYRWKQELLGAASGESVFMGTVGKAVLPIQLKGFPPVPDLVNIGQLCTQFHYLGEARRFRPFQAIESVSTMRPDVAPCMFDFTVAGAPSLPVSVLLEYAISVGEWVQPDSPAPLHLHELQNLEVNVAALRSEAGVLIFAKQGSGRWHDGQWLVNVELTRRTASGDEPLASVRLVYAREEAPSGPSLTVDRATPHTAPATHPQIVWAGFVYAPARWTRATNGALVGDVRSVAPTDLWSTAFVPEAALSGAHLENIFRAGLSLQHGSGVVDRLLLSCIRRYRSRGRLGPVIGVPDSNAWSVLDDDGRVTLRLEEMTFR